jgi:hypothetical protein
MLRLGFAIALSMALLFVPNLRAEVTFALSFPDVANHTGIGNATVEVYRLN